MLTNIRRIYYKVAHNVYFTLLNVIHLELEQSTRLLTASITLIYTEEPDIEVIKHKRLVFNITRWSDGTPAGTRVFGTTCGNTSLTLPNHKRPW